MPDEERALPACPRCDTISRAWSEAVSQRDELVSELARLREALEWADAMIWPRIKMLERHNGDKPSEESGALRRLLGPIRRAHKDGKRVASLSVLMERLRQRGDTYKAAAERYRGDREKKAALASELAAAVRERIAQWSRPYDSEEERRAAMQDSWDRLQSVLRRVEEAGETR